MLNGVLIVAEPCRQPLERSGHGLLEDGKLPESSEAGHVLVMLGTDVSPADLVAVCPWAKK